MATQEQLIQDALDTMDAYLWLRGGVAETPLPSFRDQKMAVIQRAFPDFDPKGHTTVSLRARFDMAMEVLRNPRHPQYPREPAPHRNPKIRAMQEQRLKLYKGGKK